MGQLNQLFRNRIIAGSIVVALTLVVAAILLVSASLAGRPQQLFGFVTAQEPSLPEKADIAGSAGFDKSSYLPGELSTYRIRLLWRETAVSPDLEAFKNGIGFFPFNRLDVHESRRKLDDGVSEYVLQIGLQAVDVEPVRSYQLAPPTVYYTLTGSAEQELQSYRLDPPVVHIGEYYPSDVSKVALLDYKAEIDDPRLFRQGSIALIGLLLFTLAGLVLWYFGRVRKPEDLDEPERLWRQYRSLDRTALPAREYMDQCERVFTGLLRFRLHLSPVIFWSGGDADDAEEWKGILQQARELFYRNYLPREPDAETVEQTARILDDMFARLTEEERLRREQQPSFFSRIASQYGAMTTAGVIAAFGMLMLLAALSPAAWLSPDIAVYNQIVALLHSGQPVPDIYERVAKMPEQITDPHIKSAALYNVAIAATQPELAGIDQPRQEALLAVMFQEQKVYLDALLHSLTMEDPFLLVAILRDSVRFLTISESSLKAAIRLDAADEQVRRNLELIMKRRNAYAESIEEILRGGEDAGAQGELQKQALMDLEMFMETEMPDKYAEFEEGRNNKEYFILEGF